MYGLLTFVETSVNETGFNTSLNVVEDNQSCAAVVEESWAYG